MLHHGCMANCFDIHKRTMLLHIDNKAGLWWQRKGLVTSNLPLDNLLRLQKNNQLLHHYATHNNFASGVDNGISQQSYLSQYLTHTALLAYMDASHPQDLPWRLLTPPSDIISVIASALWRKTSPRDSLIADLPPTMGTG